ncbi:MAG: DUF3572 domain-containing protein [Pseudomonadota bacterium]|nr:DUF3572 domain-containing protein [Pseudomonadota bacterium]
MNAADRARRDAAEALALQALGFVIADPDLRERFMRLSGLEPEDIRRLAADPAFGGGVLDFVLAHEPTLASFCAAAGVGPEEPARARRLLPGAPVEY